MPGGDRDVRSRGERRVPGDRRRGDRDRRDRHAPLEQLRPDERVHDPRGDARSDERGRRVRDDRAAVPARRRPERRQPADADRANRATCRRAPSRRVPAGNVPAGTISRVPPSLNAVVIRVTNPDADGRRRAHREHARHAWRTWAPRSARSPRSSASSSTSSSRTRAARPPGTEIIPETSASSEPEPVEDPVGADRPGAREVRRSRIARPGRQPRSGARRSWRSRIRSSGARSRRTRRWCADRSRVDVGEGRADGASVVYPVSAEAQQVGTIDGEAVREAIRGRSAAARHANVCETTAMHSLTSGRTG